MSKVYFVTSNAGKVKNAQDALGRFGIDVDQIAMDLIESRSEDPAQIALEKAQQAYRQLKRPVIVEDSGFFIKALGGFPMTHIKFSLNTIGLDGVLRALRGVKDRRGEWRMTLAFVYGENKYKQFTFVEKGVLVKTPRRAKRKLMSEYWRVFVPDMEPKTGKTLSELTGSDLMRWLNYYATHNQFAQFGRWFTEYCIDLF